MLAGGALGKRRPREGCHGDVGPLFTYVMPLDWKEIETITGVIGIVWAIVGFAVSILDRNRERREA